MSISKFFSRLGVTRHITKEDNREALEEIQREVDRRWERLKARDQHPLL
jgi:pyruvate ferredoxin oxidoreductase alpha subunit